MTQVTDERAAIVDWFERDFKESAKNTTKTSRLEDGRLSYSFSVVNNSGFDFSRFSFRIKVINKTSGREIGTATIKAGQWAGGEKKTFRSKLTIPADAKSLSFVMYSNSLEYEAAQSSSGTYRSSGSGYVNTGQSASGRPAGSSTGQSSQASPSYSSQRTGGTFTQRRNEKKLNKKRLGKSGWTVAGVVIGALLIIASFADSNTAQQTMTYLASGGACLAASGIYKLMLESRAKRIRAYEARVNQNGNTSIDDLAAYVGKPYDKVADDLQKMIADGFFGEAYLDLDNRMLVMMRNGMPIEDVAKSAAANKKAKRKAAREKGVVPESIDDLITMTDDAEIKTRLKNLRAVTRKIDARVEEVPDLEKQVKDFREKYYPEVVRLTDEYNEKIADMGKIGYERSHSGVGTDMSGAPVINSDPNYLEEQAAEIKTQLLALIDSVTEASENLLEKLHEDDIMDITTDIKMLQTTLASKGLLDSDFDIN